MVKRVTLHLARQRDFPNGSAQHGYDLVAPVDDSGHLDAARWRANKDICTVRRFWHGEADLAGRLVHRVGGAGGHHWAIDYDQTRSSDDEVGYRLDSHSLTKGEYITIRDADGVSRTYQVADVHAL
jgi:hypothetical protein